MNFTSNYDWTLSDPHGLEVLKQNTTPLKISCSGIYVAACCTLKAMLRDGVELSLNFSNPNGRELVRSTNDEEDWDFIIVADAAMLMSANKKFSDYRRVFEISRIPQVAFRMKGHRRAGDLPTIYVYPNSSVEHQIRLAREPGVFGDMGLPEHFKEQPILHFADYTTVITELMKPGDYIIAWEPLSSGLRRIAELKMIDRSMFSVSTSLSDIPQVAYRLTERSLDEAIGSSVFPSKCRLRSVDR